MHVAAEELVVPLESLHEPLGSDDACLLFVCVDLRTLHICT